MENEHRPLDKIQLVARFVAVAAAVCIWLLLSASLVNLPNLGALKWSEILKPCAAVVTPCVATVAIAGLAGWWRGLSLGTGGLIFLLLATSVKIGETVQRITEEVSNDDALSRMVRQTVEGATVLPGGWALLAAVAVLLLIGLATPNRPLWQN